MNVYVARFEKKEEFDEQLKSDITSLIVSLHPVIGVNGKEATINPVGIEPNVIFQGKVINHNKISQALRDMADMIDENLDGKTAETFSAPDKE